MMNNSDICYKNLKLCMSLFKCFEDVNNLSLLNMYYEFPVLRKKMSIVEIFPPAVE